MAAQKQLELKENFPDEAPLVHFYRNSTVFGGCKKSDVHSGKWIRRQKGPGQTPVDPKGIWLRSLSGWSLATFRGWTWGDVHLRVRTHKPETRLLTCAPCFLCYDFSFGGGLPPGRRHGETREVTKGPVKRAK